MKSNKTLEALSKDKPTSVRSNRTLEELEALCLKMTERERIIKDSFKAIAQELRLMARLIDKKIKEMER
jgi:hypothetical protein